MFRQAVIENVSLKQQIFADLEKYCPPHCILASNTSTIDLNLIGQKTKSEDRIVGAHFFRYCSCSLFRNYSILYLIGMHCQCKDFYTITKL
jgi:hypothetical protein